MTERGLKNIYVFYSTFTKVFFCHVFTFFKRFLFYFFLERFYIYAAEDREGETERTDVKNLLCTEDY